MQKSRAASDSAASRLLSRSNSSCINKCIISWKSLALCTAAAAVITQNARFLLKVHWVESCTVGVVCHVGITRYVRVCALLLLLAVCRISLSLRCVSEIHVTGTAVRRDLINCL